MQKQNLKITLQHVNVHICRISMCNIQITKYIQNIQYEADCLLYFTDVHGIKYAKN